MALHIYRQGCLITQRPPPLPVQLLRFSLCLLSSLALPLLSPTPPFTTGSWKLKEATTSVEKRDLPALDTGAVTWCLCSWKYECICVSTRGHVRKQRRPWSSGLWAAEGTRARAPASEQGNISPVFPKFKSWRGRGCRRFGRARPQGKLRADTQLNQRPLVYRPVPLGTASDLYFVTTRQRAVTSGRRPQTQLHIPRH